MSGLLPQNVPTIDVNTFLAMLRDNPKLPILDVREPEELDRAAWPLGVVYNYPMSRWEKEGLAGLPDPLKDRSQPMVVLCHHGQRSAFAAFILYLQGWENVVHLEGGIDRLALETDLSIPRYR